MFVQNDAEYLKNPRNDSNDKLLKVPVREVNLGDQPNCVVNNSYEVPSSGLDFWGQADYTRRDFSKVPDRGANSMNLK